MSANPPTQDAGYLKMSQQLPPDPEDISFNDEPKEPGPELWIHRLKGSEEVTATVYGNAIRGVDTHWVAGRTQPHYRNEATCPGCIAKIRIDWKGYLHCYDWKRGRQFFLELTPASRKMIANQIAPGRPLRGSIIRVTRTKGDNGRLRIVVDKQSRRDDKLPPEVDPRPSILRLYNVDPDGEEPKQPIDTSGEEPDYPMEPPPPDL